LHLRFLPAILHFVRAGFRRPVTFIHCVKGPTMPDYAYQCHDCGATFTIHLTLAEHEKSPHPTCQKCGSTKVEQLLSEAMVFTSKKS
jgi:putative FmdB family regulatory protein